MTGKLAFGTNKVTLSNRGENIGVLWVALIEKAWAKVCGSYDRIIMGTVDLGFIHLCGVPSLEYKHAEFRSQKELVWTRLQQAQRSGHIMTAGTTDKTQVMEAQMANGLRANHCYSILSVH